MTHTGYDFEIALEAFKCKDYGEVLRMALPHATAGNSDAQCMVSLLYQNGFGVSRDLAEAELWSLKAAEQGNPVAWNNLGTLYAIGGAGLTMDPIVLPSVTNERKSLVSTARSLILQGPKVDLRGQAK